MIEVDDPGDERIADFRDLATVDRRPDRPGGKGLVIAEGVPVVQRLLASPYPVRAVMGVPDRIAALGAFPAPAYAVSKEVMAAAVGFHLNRGVLASADRAPEPAPAELVRDATRVLVLEGVNDHENLGALFRNAAGLGIDAVLLGPRCADPLYRRSVRVSMGHVLRVPFARVPSWPLLTEVLRGFTVLALAPHPPSAELSAVAARPRMALVVGAEGSGLTDEALAAATLRVRIPMAAGVDSLNVATAAAIAIHQLRPATPATPGAAERTAPGRR